METSILDSLNALSAQASAAMPKPVPLLHVRNYDLADYTYEVIMKQIKAFEDDLDENHEVALKLTSFGQSLTLNVTDVGYPQIGGEQLCDLLQLCCFIDLPDETIRRIRRRKRYSNSILHCLFPLSVVNCS